MGKLAKGTSIMKLFPGEHIIEAFCIQEQQYNDLILITNKCSFIKHNTKEIKTSKKGELGIMGINFNDNIKIKNRIINCFFKNNYIYIKTNLERYEILETNQLDKASYKKERKLNIKLNKNEFIEYIFRMLIQEES